MVFAVDWTPNVWHFIVRLLISLVCGCLIGLERKTRSKEAGIRTHAIVCMASCLFMFLSKYLTSADFGGNGLSSDATRIAAGVVQGIGFLGAGIIMYRKDVMHGLTTAAGVWATAAIGMAVGAGFIVIGVITTVLLLLLQLFFRLPLKSFMTKHLTVLKLQVWVENQDVLNGIIAKLGKGRVSSYEVKNVDGRLLATVEFSSLTHFSVETMNNLLIDDPTHILSVESNIE